MHTLMNMTLPSVLLISGLFVLLAKSINKQLESVTRLISINTLLILAGDRTRSLGLLSAAMDAELAMAGTVV